MDRVIIRCFDNLQYDICDFPQVDDQQCEIEALTRKCCVLYGYTGTGKSTVFNRMLLRIATENGHQFWITAKEIYLNRTTKIIDQQCRNTHEWIKIFGTISLSRKTRKTDKNDRSSRSHLIVEIAGHCLVDLAGAEALNPDAPHESRDINKSLSALKRCLEALEQNAKHIPFRDSQLTRELSVYLDFSTLLIACVKRDDPQSMHTLQFCNSFLNIKKSAFAVVHDAQTEDIRRLIDFLESELCHQEVHDSHTHLHSVAS